MNGAAITGRPRRGAKLVETFDRHEVSFVSVTLRTPTAPEANSLGVLGF